MTQPLSHTSDITLKPGMKFRSRRLTDYTVTLVRPTTFSVWPDLWLIEPAGTSAHGSYSEREAKLLNPTIYELTSLGDAHDEPDTGKPPCDFCRRTVPCECACPVDATADEVRARCMCTCGRCLAPPWPTW